MRYAIPYTMVGGTKFYDRKENKDVIAYLRLLYNPEDSLSLMRVINVPKLKHRRDDDRAFGRLRRAEWYFPL